MIAVKNWSLLISFRAGTKNKVGRQPQTVFCY